ncbi:MAG: hypothetical protein KAI47_12720, partial [Deltaproteobacteria bacterium]|nr:hypothetical protein [Deltaproteobacteria bacterium]
TLEARARGRARDLFRVEIPEEIEMAELHLDQPTDDFEVMIFVHKNVLDRLVRQVAATRRSIVALEISWVLADVERSRITHVFRPARPTLDARTLLDLILLWLNSGPATDLVDAIVMRAPEVGVATPRQLRLFERREDLAEDALRLAQSRLIAAFGASAVVTPTLADTHRPEARVVWRSPSEGAALPEGAVTPEGGGDAARARSHAEMAGPWEAGGLGLMGAMPPALDLFDPPRPVIVRGSWLRVVYPGPGVRSSEPTWRRIVTRRGPYEIAGAWWREDGFSRRYEVVTLDDGSQLWIFHDRRGAFLQAYLD